MLLVDSSVWIDHVRNLDTDAIRFVELRDEDEEIAMAGVIFQEVLQGARDDAVYDRLRDMFSGLLLLEPRDLSTYEVAAHLHRRARRAGFTIRKPTDCLIAALALEHGAMLVHNDRDFVFLAQVEPALIIYPGRPH
jgi:predicted nucleic acid-binding protein